MFREVFCLVGSGGTDVDAPTTGVDTGYCKNLRVEEVPQAFVGHFTYLFVEVVLVSQGDDVFQEGGMIRQAVGLHMDVDAAPIRLFRDFAVTP